MNPTKPATTIPIKPQEQKTTTSAADRILAEAKRVEDMPPHPIVMPQVKQPQAKQLDDQPFEIVSFIAQFEQDAIEGKFGKLGTGPYDKLLIERVRQNMDFVPERDTKIHTLIADSVRRFDAKTRNRV